MQTKNSMLDALFNKMVGHVISLNGVHTTLHAVFGEELETFFFLIENMETHRFSTIPAKILFSINAIKVDKNPKPD